MNFQNVYFVDRSTLSCQFKLQTKVVIVFSNNSHWLNYNPLGMRIENCAVSRVIWFFVQTLYFKWCIQVSEYLTEKRRLWLETPIWEAFSSMWRTCSNHRSLHYLRKVYMLGRFAQDRTSALVTLPCQDDERRK